MKKLIMLISLLLVSYLSFSQTATTSIPADTIVPLKVPIAKLVIKDLIKGDGAIEELKETQKILKLTEDKIVIKDTIISSLNSKISNLNFIIGEKDKQFGLERQKSTELYKELKQQRRTTFLYKVGTFIGILATGVLLVN
jgi:peptidoglycan hydrolase CwlO-like protein